MSSAVVDVAGRVEPGFEPVREAFARNFAEHGEVGADCCVYVDQRTVVDIWAGMADQRSALPWSERTLEIVWSTTKGVTAICIHRLVERGQIDLEAPVATYWPEFAAAGKERITVRQLLSHQGGLAAIDRPLTVADVYSWEPVVEALAAQPPNWEPGTAHGYHALTWGWLAGELIRRVDGRSPGRYLAEEVAGPLGLDLWIGLPESEDDRVAQLVPAPPPAPDDPWLKAMSDPGSLLHRAFLNPAGVVAAYGEPAWRRAEIPAGNGIGNARSLARLYAACIGEVDGVRLLAPQTVERARRTEAQGMDLVTLYETHYGPGFQLPFPFRPMAGPGSFGHYGSGGSAGFAHLERGLAFGYTMNRMYPANGLDPRTRALVDALLTCL